MNYYLDTEFIEGFRRTRGRTPFSMRDTHFIDLISIGIVSEDGRQYYAISKEYRYSEASDWVRENVIAKAYTDAVHGDSRNRWDVTNFQYGYGLSNLTIRQELFDFFRCGYEHGQNWAPEDIMIYGYFADYDWVLFCSLFGKMIDLPKGFPMFCMDLKQIMVQTGLSESWKNRHCPGPILEHNALHDAIWNQQLHRAITQYQLRS